MEDCSLRTQQRHSTQFLNKFIVLAALSHSQPDEEDQRRALAGEPEQFLIILYIKYKFDI